MKKRKESSFGLREFGHQIGIDKVDQAMILKKNKIITLLKKERLRKNLTQTELAEKLGTKQPAVARMEAGIVGEVSFDFLIRTAIVLGVNLNIGKKFA